MKPVDYALFLLSRQDYTVCTMSKALKKKGYRKFEIEEALDFVTKNGFVDDRRYIYNYIDGKRETYGKIRMRNFLYKKGISAELFDEVYEEYENDSGQNMEDAEHAVAVELVKKKLELLNDSSVNELKNPKIRNKVLSALARKGFGYDVAKNAFDEVVEDFNK